MYFQAPSGVNFLDVHLWNLLQVKSLFCSEADKLLLALISSTSILWNLLQVELVVGAFSAVIQKETKQLVGSSYKSHLWYRQWGNPEVIKPGLL